MNLIRVKTHLDSDTIHLPQVKPLVGKDVEIIVLERTTEANGHKSLDEIAMEQGKQPITDARILLGGWPPEERNDGFEDDLRARRKEDMVRDIDG